MSIDLSRVDISLKQFQKIASGKYNAGEVTLEGETKLGRTNHHIHFRSFNDTEHTHESVLAVKNAFVKALSAGGVDAAEIARIRQDLGLSAEGAADKALHERSLKPLTRQQVRTILDRNAAAINAHAGNDRDARVRTSEQIYGAGGMKESRAEKRDTVNAALAGAGGTEEHEGIALAEAVVAGDVDFDPGKSPKALAAQIRAQRNQILQKANGHPDANREAVIEFRVTSSGQHVRIPTGRSEAAFVRKLDEMLIRLTSNRPLDRRGIEVRTAFGALPDRQARRDWLDGLGNDPDAGFKIRTAVVLMLTEAGIDDWETLSAINRVDDAIVRDFARMLVQVDGALRGDALRNDQAMLSLANLVALEGAANVPGNQCATIPATSPKMWNDGIRAAIAVNEPDNLPHDIKALLDEIPGHVRGLFGEDVIGQHESGVELVGATGASKVVPQDLAERATPENIRARVFAHVENVCAERHARGLIARAFVEAGGSGRYPGRLWNDWGHTRPELRQRLLAARSAAEIEAIFDESRETVASDVKRYIAVERSLCKVPSFLRDTLAAKLGVPPACLAKGLDLNKFDSKVSDLGNQIRRGEIPAATDGEVEAAVRALAEQRAGQYVDAIAAVERLTDIPPAVRDALLDFVLTIDSPQKFDAARSVAAARERLRAHADAVEAALVPDAPKDAVYEAMRQFGTELLKVVPGLFPADAQVGAEEITTFGNALVATVVFDRPGFAGKLAAFFARDDVKRDDPYDFGSPAFAGHRFLDVLPAPGAKAALASSLGTPAMPPFHARALMKAFEDASLGDLPVAARMAVLRPSHPAGAALAQAIAAEPGHVSPDRLRELAAPLFRTHVAAGGIALPPADAARMEAALAKYDGGLPAADRLRLRQYAESLDFSAAAAPASEKAIAERLDEICGGGFFTNPASSASRRALAAGFTTADLPLLALLEDLIEASGPTDEQAVEMLLDPQSDFRQRWNAALLRHANVAGDPARLAALPAEDKVAVARAVLLCEDDADLLAIVTNGITRAIRDGAGHVRNPVAIQRIVENAAANLAEVREAAAGDPDALAAGLDLLKGLETRAAPPGYLKHLLDAARRAPLDAVSKLRRRSPPAEINRALLQLNGNIVSILAARDSGGLATDGDTALACRHFLLRTMVERLTESQRRSLRDALSSQNAARTAAFHDAVAADLVEMPPMASGVHEHLNNLAAALSRDAAFLSGVVRRSLGEADAPGRLPALQGDLDLPGMGAQAIFDQILATATAECDAARETYLRRTFPGDTPAATALRGIFGNRLALTRPINPANKIRTLFAGATGKMLTLNLVRGARKLATGPYATSQFAIDRHRQIDVHLPGGALLSTDPAAAADELARFVTGRPDAAYAALGAAEKTKVHVVMSLLTQESGTAVFTAPALSLDPNGTTTTFSYGGGTQTRTFHLDRDAQGGITIRFENTVRPTHLLVDLDAHPLGAGSELKGGYTLTFSAQKLDTLAQKDFARCNNDPADNTMRAIPPVTQKLITAVDRLPVPFRLDRDLDLETTFTATLR